MSAEASPLSPELVLPAIAAPMTGVSTVRLVQAACRAGIVGAFPTGNCRSTAELDEWLDAIESARNSPNPSGRPIGPVAANLIVHRSNTRLDADLDCVIARRVGLVITSVGDPTSVLAPLQAAGCQVFVDVASLKHATKALEAGADGLVLLSAGAGGHTGWANPFSFVRAVRKFYSGTLVLAGGVSDGAALWAALVLGYDMGYLGTKLIATTESGASDGWKRDVVEASLDDVTLGTSPVGVAASILRSSGSAGHTVSGVDAISSVGDVVAQTEREYADARQRNAAMLQR